MAIQDEIYYTTPNGAKISQTEALERYGSEQFDALVNTGDLIEFQQEEEPDLNQGDSFYETPNGNVYTEGDLISQYGMDDFNSYVEGGNLKKKDSAESLSTFADTDLALEATSKLPVSEGINSGEVDYFQGAFGDVLRGIDMIQPLGIGDFIDDMARSIDAGFQNGQIAESGNDLLYGGSDASYEDIQEFIAKTEGARSLGPSDEMQDYTRIYEEEKADGLGAWGVIKGLILNPSVIPEVLASSFSAMANPDSAAAAGVIIGGGATVGAVAGGGILSAPGAIAGAAATLPYAFAAAGTVLETGLTFGELLQVKLENKGLELTNENVKTILNDPEALAELRFDAIARGATIGAIDALTGRLGGKVAAPLLKQAGKAGKVAGKGLKRKAIGKAALVEGVGGSLGETAGITATNIYGEDGQDYDTGEIMLEGLAEMPGSVKDIIAVRYQKPKYRINGKKATVEEIDQVINGMTYEQLTAPNFKIQIDNDFDGRAEILQEKIVKGRTRAAVKAANPELNETTLNRIVELEQQVTEQEGKVLGTVTGKKKISDLKAEIINLQENQLEAEAVSETDAVLDEDGNAVESEVVAEEVNTLEQFDTLTPEEKLEYVDEAGKVLIAEAEANGEVEFTFTEEQINQKASELLQEDVSSLEGELKDETRFSVAEEGDALVSVDAADSELIQEEMNNEFPESEVNFESTTEGGGVTVSPFEDSNSTEEFTDADAVEMGFESKEKAVQPIENFNGIPMITGISDTAAGGTIKDSKGGDMKAKGGVMFNALAKVKAAWAGVKPSTSEGQFKNAVKLYNKNKPLFDRLWKEGKLPNGQIPMAIVRMGNDAINSNEIVFRYLSPEINAQSQENQTAALNDLIAGLKVKKGKQNPKLLKFINDNKITTLGALTDAVVKDANARAKGNYKTTLTLDERAALYDNLTSPEGTKKANKPFLKSLYKGTTDNSSVFLSDNIYNAVGEPSMMKTKKGDIVSIVGVDVLDGGVVDIEHGNYGSGPKGGLIALISNPTNGMNVFPEWKAKSNRVFKENTAGVAPTKKGTAAQTMGTAANDKAFQGAAVETDMSDIQVLAAKFRFAFPGVTVVSTKAEFEAMLKQPGIRTKVSEGKIILGMTTDGKVFLNPESSSLGTPIHEFGHVWIDFLRSKASGDAGTALLKKGLKLVEGTEALKTAIEKYGDNALAREEALVELMANKGETIIDAGQKSNFKEWLNATFKYIQKKFVRSEKLFAKEDIKELKRQLKNEEITQEQYDKSLKKIQASIKKSIASLTIEDFINTGLADLFGGKELSASFDAKKESKGIMPRFELGDSVVDFIKQARAQGIKEVAIKVALAKRGIDYADYLVQLKASKGKASPKVKMSNSYAKGFDRVLKEIDGIVKKIKARNVKGDTNPNVILKAAQKYLQGTKLYENATDVQREQMVRDLRASLGIKEKKTKTPAAAIKKSQQIFGNFKKDEVITFTIKQMWAERIRALNRGAKSGIRAFVKSQVAIAAEITDMVKKGTITTKQMASILRKFTGVNPLSDSSIERFVDYMSKVINNAEYDSQIARAKSLVSRAKKNIAKKIGVADGIRTQLQQILSIKPNMIPESVFQQYLELVEEFGANLAVLNLSEIQSTTDAVEKILAALDLEFSLIPELRDRMMAYGPEFLDGKIDFAATIKAMLKDESITEAEAELMKKYKSDIVPAKTKIEKTKVELAKEKADTIDRILKTKVLKVSELPSKLEKALADRFEKLYNNKTVLEGLDIEDLKQIEKLIDNIQSGYLPHLVQLQVSKMDSILDGKLLSDALTVGKVPTISSLYAKAKNLINRGKRGAISEAIRRNPLFYIDQVFGNYKGKPIFKALFDRAAIAQERFDTEMKIIFGKLEDAETAVFKSFNKDGNKTLVSKFKQMIYMIQLEHDTNIGNKEVSNASGFILKTIDKIDAGETTFSMDDAEALRKIYDEFKDDNGEIDIEKLNASFNKAELASIKTIQEINKELGPKAIFTAAIIRGDAMTPRNNYVHLSVLPDSKTEAESAPTSIAKFNKSLKPSTKAKSLIERTGSTSPLNFDVYASAGKGAKGVLIDFHLTEPIRTARRTILQAEANLKADGTRVSTEDREKLNAVKDAFNEVVENLLQNSYTETSLGGAVVKWLQKNGYRAILASTTRWVAELSSNGAFAMITNPKAFLAGAKVGLGFLNSDAAPKVMSVLGSKQTTRIYPNEDMSGRMIDSRLLNQNEGLKGGRTKGRFMNKLTQIWNKTGKKYQGGVATIADGLISTPDKIVMRPMWFGSFQNAFEAITGQKPDLDKIAAEDSAYMEKFSEALTQATTEADETSVMTGSTANPFMGILKGTSKATDGVPTKVFNAFNNFMTTFLIYEYITARTGVMNAIGKGHMTKQKGAQLIAGSATRMVMYTMMAQILGEALGGIAGEEEEEQKSLDKKLGQAVASTFSSMLFGRDFGNATKSIINIGIENFNIEFLDMLREGDYDQYKDGLAYQIIPPNTDGRGTNLGEIITKMTASLGPAAKTLDFMIRKGTEADKKTPQAIKRREDEIMMRLPLELLGNSGFIPMYKDVRRLVLRSIYSEMRTAAAENKFSKQNELNRLQGYKTRSDMKRYDPSLWSETFGPNSEFFEAEQAEKTIQRNLRKEKQRIKDETYNYNGNTKSGFGSGGFGSGGFGSGSFGSGSRKKKSGFGSEGFGN